MPCKSNSHFDMNHALLYIKYDFCHGRRCTSNIKIIQLLVVLGGCGAMFDVHIESADFNGKKLVQQHMMVNKVLFFC